MKVTITETLHQQYGMQEWGLRGFSVYAETVEESKNYSLSEGEPEDMIFGRNLQGPGAIKKMIKMAHKAGLEGEELQIETEQEKI